MTMTPLGFDEYQNLAEKTAIYPQSGSGTFSAVSYAVLGLANEAGEVGGKLKKAWRDDEGQITPERRAQILDELGDVLWYLAAVATELEVDLSSVARENVLKLQDRLERGVIGGDGDTR